MALSFRPRRQNRDLMALCGLQSTTLWLSCLDSGAGPRLGQSERDVKRVVGTNKIWKKPCREETATPGVNTVVLGCLGEVASSTVMS